MTAVVAIINYQGRVLIGKKRADSEKFLAGEWHIPGETIIWNETDERALKRGMKEETGLDITVGRLVGTSITPASKSEARWYECFAQTEDAVPGSDLEELRWVPKEIVPYYMGIKSVGLWPPELRNYFG